MCHPTTTEFLKALPKCEHHMHIEGSLEPNLLFQLSKANQIPLDPKYYSDIPTLEERYKNFTSLDDFLHYYNLALAVLITSSDFEQLAYDYILRAHSDGVVHAEVFFDPQAHTERGIDLKTVIKGLNKGLRKGGQEFGISTSLIMCFVRHFSVEKAITAVKEIVPYVTSGDVIGLGCDSTEKGNPPEKYTAVYDLARELGFKNLTSHSGEEGPAEYVRTSVYKMGIKRIDHGVHSADDPELMKDLARDGVFLTVCPLSNVRLRCTPTVKDSPIPKFLAAGVKFSINSDDPAYFGGYILDNYIAVQDAFNFTKSTWIALMVDAIDNSWCSPERKAEMHSLLEKVVQDYLGKEIR